MTFALYGHPFSSYTWKALIALYAAEAEFEFRTVGPDHPDNLAFVRREHPAGKFPVLTHGGTTIVEATAILEYLHLHHPALAQLIPAKPDDSVTIRMLDRVFDNYVMGNMQRVVNAYLADANNPDPAEVAAGKDGLNRTYRWLERWLRENSLPAHVSLITCAAAPSLFYADWVEPILANCPRVAALRAELLALPPVARCVDEARPWRRFFPLGAPDRD
ncbi:MAG: glutathione S-transferase family protein [Novosphingobium sp.]